MDDLNDVLVFSKVAELGSFTAAAQRLGLPKSSVSARVARLEARLGTRLLERSTRKLRLTPVGERYQEHAKRVLLELVEASAAVDRFRAQPSGLLRVSASVVMGQELLRPIVNEFLQRHPQVQLFVDLSNRQVDLLEEGFDVVIRAGRLADSNLVARRLGHAGARLFASPAYLRRRGVPKEPAALAGHDLLEGSPAPHTDGWTLRHDSDGHTVRVEAPFRLVANDTPMLQAAAVEGLGIASLATFAAQADVDAGRLRVVLPHWSTRQLDIHAVFPSFKSLSPSLRAFVDLVAERLHVRLNAGPLAVKAVR
jgi:DNA-binding transcriptional LysR family regulator